MDKSTGFLLFTLGFLIAQLIYNRLLERSSARFNAACDRTQYYRERLEQCEQGMDRYPKI
jgi:hypothetical protein